MSSSRNAFLMSPPLNSSRRPNSVLLPVNENFSAALYYQTYSLGDNLSDCSGKVSMKCVRYHKKRQGEFNSNVCSPGDPSLSPTSEQHSSTRVTEMDFLKALSSVAWCKSHVSIWKGKICGKPGGRAVILEESRHSFSQNTSIWQIHCQDAGGNVKFRTRGKQDD